MRAAGLNVPAEPSHHSNARRPRRSALPALGGEPLDEVPLAEEEHDDHRDRGDHAGGEDDLPFHLAALAELVEHGLEPTRQGEQRWIAQVDQRPYSDQLAWTSKT